MPSIRERAIGIKEVLTKSTDEAHIRESVKEFELLNKSKNIRKITMDIMPHMNEALKALKNSIKKMKIESEDDLQLKEQLKQQLKKLEKRFINQRNKVKLSHRKRLKELRKGGKKPQKGAILWRSKPKRAKTFHWWWSKPLTQGK